MSNQLIFTVTTFYSMVLFLPIAAILLWLKPSLWLHLLTLFIGFFLGLLDLKTTEVGVSVILLLTFGFFAGFAQPKRAWRWGLFVGIWIPVLALVASSLGITHPTDTELITSLIALAFAFAGAYGGALVGRFAPREPSPIMRQEF